MGGDRHTRARKDHPAGDAIDWLRLIRSRRVGPTTFWRLLEEHGTVAAALAALPDVARAAGVTDYAPCPEGVARAEMRAGHACGARLIHAGMADYPSALRDLADAPPVLWAVGDATLMHKPVVALVGARNASSLGQRMARKLAAGLAGAGYVVVSGLARGIDAAAHQAALTAGGTIAVQAGGVDVMYPPENAALAGEIGSAGLRLSERPPGEQPQARHFPMRNRLISGLSRAVVVVEAAARSGSLITARDALDQGREVLAVPGHPLDARAAGCNQLIREGATLVRGVEDVIEALGRLPHAPAPGGAVRAPGPGQARPGGCPARSAAPWPDNDAPGRGPVFNRPPQTAHAHNPVESTEQTERGVQSRDDHMRHPVGHGVMATGPTQSATGAVPASPTPGMDATLKLHRQILDRLGPSPLAEDQLIRDLALPASAVAPELVALELEGRIERQTGGLLSRRS